MTVGARCVMVCCTVASQLDKYSHSFVYNSFMMTDNEKPLILISNDDGLQAKGIRFLADGLDGVDAGHCPKLHLRKTGHGPQGVTSKDWCGEARPDGMYLRFGRTGSGGQGRFVAADACCRQDPVCELRQRAARKLRDGYVLIHSENMR